MNPNAFKTGCIEKASQLTENVIQNGEKTARAREIADTIYNKLFRSRPNAAPNNVAETPQCIEDKVFETSIVLDDLINTLIEIAERL